VRDQDFLSQVDLDYTHATTTLNTRTKGAGDAKVRRLVHAYVGKLEVLAHRLRTQETSPPYAPVRLGFLHGIGQIISGLRLEYGSGTNAGINAGIAIVQKGSKRLTDAYEQLFAVSRSLCPGSVLASGTPPP
jgi:hypothetical protein